MWTAHKWINRLIWSTEYYFQILHNFHKRLLTGFYLFLVASYVAPTKYKITRKVLKKQQNNVVLCQQQSKAHTTFPGPKHLSNTKKLWHDPNMLICPLKMCFEQVYCFPSKVSLSTSRPLALTWRYNILSRTCLTQYTRCWVAKRTAKRSLLAMKETSCTDSQNCSLADLRKNTSIQISWKYTFKVQARLLLGVGSLHQYKFWHLSGGITMELSVCLLIFTHLSLISRTFPQTYCDCSSLATYIRMETRRCNFTCKTQNDD